MYSVNSTSFGIFLSIEMTILFQVYSVETAVILILSQVQRSPPIIIPVHSINIDYYGISYDTGVNISNSQPIP